MQHQTYLSDKDELGVGPRILAVVIILALLGAVGGYVVYGSGMWNPAPLTQTTGQ